MGVADNGGIWLVDVVSERESDCRKPDSDEGGSDMEAIPCGEIEDAGPDGAGAEDQPRYDHQDWFEGWVWPT